MICSKAEGITMAPMDTRPQVQLCRLLHCAKSEACPSGQSSVEGNRHRSQTHWGCILVFCLCSALGVLVHQGLSLDLLHPMGPGNASSGQQS